MTKLNGVFSWNRTAHFQATMRHVEKDEEYISVGTYWMLTGMIGDKYQYILLGRFIDGAFEFNNSLAKKGYIYQENIPAVNKYFK